MPAILWKPLLAMGAIFWAILCIWDRTKKMQKELIKDEVLSKSEYLLKENSNGTSKRVHWELFIILLLVCIWVGIKRLMSKFRERLAFVNTAQPVALDMSRRSEAILRETFRNRNARYQRSYRDILEQSTPTTSAPVLSEESRERPSTSKRLHACIKAPGAKKPKLMPANLNFESTSSDNNTNDSQRVSQMIEMTSNRLNRCLHALEARTAREATSQSEPEVASEPIENDRLHGCIKTYGCRNHGSKLDTIVEEPSREASNESMPSAGTASTGNMHTVAEKVQKCTMALANFLELDRLSEDSVLDDGVQVAQSEDDDSVDDTTRLMNSPKVDVRLMKLMLQHLEHDVEVLKKRRTGIISGTPEFQKLCDNLHNTNRN